MISKTLYIPLSMILSGCVTAGYFDSTQNISTDEKLFELVSQEVTSAMKNSFPPAKTTIFFVHKNEDLSKKIETDLRGVGYALVVTEDKAVQGQLKFGYTVDVVESLTVLRFVAGETFLGSRAYRKSPDGTYQGAGPLLVRRSPQ